MNLRSFLLILASVSLSALAQVSLKYGMSSPGVQRALAGSSRPLETALIVAGSKGVLLGLLLYGLGMVLWLLVLARLDVSLAYPFVGLGFLLTALLGVLLFQEPVGGLRLTGTLMVAAGILMVART